MAISTYSELQTAISNWLNRSDLTTRIPEFIALAEAKINRELRIRAMESRVRTATASGDIYVSLPSDFLEAIRVTIIASPNRDCKYVSPTAMSQLYLSNWTDQPYAYTIEGTELRLGPPTDAAYTVELAYYASFSALSDSNTTNWLTSNAPDLLLYMTLAEAEPYLKNDTRLMVWKGLAAEIMENIKDMDRRARFSGGGLEMRPV